MMRTAIVPPSAAVRPAVAPIDAADVGSAGAASEGTFMSNQFKSGFVALLINQQKVTIKYGGATIQPTDPKLPDMLRQKTEIGKTSISKRQVVNAVKMKQVRELLREYFDVMDVPDDEDSLVAFIAKKFGEQKAHYEALDAKYDTGRKYPDRNKVQQAIQIMNDILSQQKDNIALIDRVLKREDNLFDSKEALQDVEDFFKTKVQIFDAAAQMERDLRNELDYLSREPEANDALNKIRLVVMVTGGFSYKKIPELNGLMETVKEGHGRLLTAKREEVNDIITQCMGAVHQAAREEYNVRDISAKADEYYSQKKQQVKELQSLALLDGLIPPMLQYKDTTVDRIETLLAPPAPKPIISSIVRFCTSGFCVKTILTCRAESHDRGDNRLGKVALYRFLWSIAVFRTQSPQPFKL